MDNQFTVMFGDSLEKELKAIKKKNIVLQICSGSNSRGRNSLSLCDEIIILNKYLDSLSPSKILFNSIAFNAMLDDTYNSNLYRFISKLIKIPIVEFQYCGVSVRFCGELFIESNYYTKNDYKMFNIKFKGCQIIPDCKTAIIKSLENNYVVREVEIDDFTSKSDLNDVSLDGKIKSYLYRNRARHLCRQAAISLIIIKKRRNKFFDFVDKSLVLEIAKSIYNQRSDFEWLKIILSQEVQQLRFINN